MEDAFRKALEIITDQIRILEAECTAFIDATAAENRSLNKQVRTEVPGGSFKKQSIFTEATAYNRRTSLTSTRDPAQPARRSLKHSEHEASSQRSSQLIASFLQGVRRDPAQNNRESHQYFEDEIHKGTGVAIESWLPSAPRDSTGVAIESWLPSTPQDSTKALEPAAPTREPQNFPGWRLSPGSPCQPEAHLLMESLEAESLQVSTPKEGGQSLTNGDLRMSTFPIGKTVSCFEDSTMLSEEIVRSARPDSLESATGLKNSGTVFERYDVRPLWWDDEFDHIPLREITRQARSELMVVKASKSLTSSLDEPTGKHSCFILHPDSTFRTVWILICVVLLAYDMIMVPFVICFEPPESMFSKVLVLMASIFWTADIPLNFISGVRTIDGVEVRFQHIACLYAKSWLMFDILLVVPEWVTLAIGNQFRSHSVLRLARWGRLTRLLRMARVMRFESLRPVVRRIAYKYHLSKMYVAVTQGWIGTSVLLVLSTHMISCFWYLSGRSFDNGWVEANGLSDADVRRNYVISVRWTLCRLQGLFSNYSITSTADMLMDIFLILGTFILASSYISTMTAVKMTRVTDRCPSLWEKGIAFVRRHDVSVELSFRLEKALEAAHYAGAIEIACDEMTLLEALPASLQQDLIYEARKSAVLKNMFFNNLLCVNRQATRHICNEAITPLITVEEEVLFTYADACHRMLFINSGKSKYAFGVRDDYDNAQELEQGSFISEPVLWTTWEHKGHLKSMRESVMLALDAYNFAEVVLQHKGPNMVANRYAKHFVWKMNQATMLHDMTSFPELSLTQLDTDLFVGSFEDHFMFISHYKVEAGTEASLMRDLLVPMLAEDRSNQANNLHSPVFIDSEDLSDLSRLKAHVVGSSSLVLLLTPGLLSRPWCLIELVTALENDVNIVPVEIQRPGYSYRYPDDEFYASLREGRLLGQNAVELLTAEGIQLEQVEAAIRKVFLKIACPFSPHRSKAIRQAELDAILTRCNGTRPDATFSKKGSGKDKDFTKSFGQGSPHLRGVVGGSHNKVSIRPWAQSMPSVI